MIIVGIICGVVVFVAILCLVLSYICYKKVFYSPARKVLQDDEYEIPDGDIYEVFRDEMVEWTKMTRSYPHEELEIRSFDGLVLRGRYYEYKKGAITELLFHGYQGNAERDLSGGVDRCFALGRNALIIDHRASGRSYGNVISFGINEKRDCLSWIEFAISHFGNDVKLIITGISMGAATVMMAAGEKLPQNVVCVLADCGYSSAREIIKKVIAEMKLPAEIVYPFVRLGARLFGRFSLEETSPMEAVKKSSVPIIFIHGDTDDFVPCCMSERLYEACSSERKCFVAIKGAGHGLAYPVDKEGYLKALSDFQDECGF